MRWNSCPATRLIKANQSESDMPCYQATIVRSEPAIPSCVVEFVAGSDLQAIARMPEVERDCVVEIWRGNRLIAMIEGDRVTVANYDLEVVTAGLLEWVAAGR